MTIIAQKEFIEQALNQKIRVDGRTAFDVRKIRITLGPQVGQCEIQLGKTRVLAQVSCEIVRPHGGNPQEGILQFNTDLSPMASLKFDSSLRSSDEEIHVSRLLEKSLRKSRAVDTEGLCIIAGEQVWCIRVDVRVLDHDGNIIDCACIAAIAAMMHFKRPDVTVKGDEVIIHTFEEKHPIPLSIHHIPICTTFSFFENGRLMVVDPTAQEEACHDGTMTIVTNIHREVCCLTNAGGCPLEMEQILRCNQIAILKSAEITTLVRNAVIAANSSKSTFS